VKKKLAFLILLVFTLTGRPGMLKAQTVPEYILDKKIALSGDGSYDYLLVDPTARRLYVSHGTTVHIIDLNTEAQIGIIENMQGVHGIAISHEVNKGFISDGKANAVVVFDLSDFKTVAIIPIAGKKPDGITYDPFSGKVFAFNGGSNNASVIDINSLKEVATIDLGGAPEFAASDGHGKIYNNLEDKSSLNVIDTKSMRVIANYPLSPCGGPTGLALDLIHQRLFTVCRENKGMSVVDLRTGKVITTLPIGAGVDAVAYDPETKLVFCSNGDGTTTVIVQETPDSYKVIQSLPTQFRAKTLALDPVTHKIYLSVVDFQNGSKNAVAGSFHVLVFKPKS